MHLVRVDRQAFRVERAHWHVPSRCVRHGRDRGVGVRGDERHELAAFAPRPAEEQNLLVPRRSGPRVADDESAGAHLQPSRRGVPGALHFERGERVANARVDAAVLRVQSRVKRAVRVARQSGHFSVLSVVVAAAASGARARRALQPVQLLYHAPRDRHAHAYGTEVGATRIVSRPAARRLRIRAEAVQQRGQAPVAAAHERVGVQHDGQLANARAHRRVRHARGLARRRRNLQRCRRERLEAGREGYRKRTPRPRARLGGRPRPNPGPRPGPRAVAVGTVFMTTRGGERAQRLAHHFGVHLHSISRVVPWRRDVLGGGLVPTPVDVHRVVHRLPGAGTTDEVEVGTLQKSRSLTVQLSNNQPVNSLETTLGGRFFPRRRGDNEQRRERRRVRTTRTSTTEGPQYTWSATRRVRRRRAGR